MRAHYVLPFLILLAPQLVSSFKFLVFSPQFAVSHVNFLAKISDTLVDAGHEVVILAPRIDPLIRGARTKKARVIELPENEFSKRWDAARIRAMDLYWNTSILALMSEGSELFAAVTLTMNATVRHPGLLEQLRSENFDAAITEDPAGFGIFHLLGIEKTVFAISFTNYDFTYGITQIPNNPSYVPSIFSPWGDKMSFFQRVANTLASYGFGIMMFSRIRWLQPLFEQDLWEVTANNSLVLLNSEPLLDYPRPTTHKVIEIGGIQCGVEGEPLDEYWNEVLGRRNRTVILSFGTYIRASTMPDEYKETIRNAFAKFDDVTFIWKYENPEHNVSQGIDNIVVSKWLPQVALLNDPRLTAFITHGGQGSTLEAAYAGIPMLMVPTQGDQHRNAAMIKRAGLGNIVSLSDLEGGDHLELQIRELLDNEEYFANAKKMAAMLKNRPFTAKERLVRNLEFLAKYGPLRMLDHEGRNLNFIQYYLIDVLLFITFVVVLVLGLLGLCCVASCRFCCIRLSYHRMNSSCTFAEELNDFYPIQAVQWFYELIIALYITIIIFSGLILLQSSQLVYRYIANNKCDAQVPKSWCIFRYINTTTGLTFAMIHLAITIQHFLSAFLFSIRVQLFAARLSILCSYASTIVYGVIAFSRDSLSGRIAYCSGFTANSADVSFIPPFRKKLGFFSVLMFILYLILALNILNTLASVFLWMYNVNCQNYEQSYDLSLSFHRRQNIYAMQQFLPIASIQAVFYFIFFLTVYFAQALQSRMSPVWCTFTAGVANVVPQYCLLTPLTFLILIKRGRFKRVEHVQSMLNLQKDSKKAYFDSPKDQWK